MKTIKFDDGADVLFVTYDPKHDKDYTTYIQSEIHGTICIAFLVATRAVAKELNLSTQELLEYTAKLLKKVE